MTCNFFYKLQSQSRKALRPLSLWEMKFDPQRRESRSPPTSVVSERLIITSLTVEFDGFFFSLKRGNRSSTNHLHGLLILSSARRGRAVDGAEEDDFLGDLKAAP